MPGDEQTSGMANNSCYPPYATLKSTPNQLDPQFLPKEVMEEEDVVDDEEEEEESHYSLIRQPDGRAEER